MSKIRVESSAVAALRRQIFGQVLVEGDNGYDGERSGWNLLSQGRPAVIVVPESAHDVSAAVRTAADLGLPVAVRATGHGPSVPTDGSLLISTRRIATLQIDPADRLARVGAGVAVEAVVEAAGARGLAALAGSARDISMVGYLSGGGLPILGRKYGYAADHVHAIEMVTADGQQRRVTATEEPDLFWAVRGGRCNFGIVTAAEIELLPLSHLYGGMLLYPGVATVEVLRGWLAWCARQPAEMSTSLALMRVPDLPIFPDEMRGEFVIMLRIAYVGDSTEGKELAGPLRAMGPILDTVTEMPASKIGDIHDDPTQPLPVVDRSMLLRRLDDDAIMRIHELVGPAAADPVTMLEIRLLGGALGQAPAVPNAIGRRDAEWTMNVATLVGPGEETAATLGQQAVMTSLMPWCAGGPVPTFLHTHDAAQRQVRTAYRDEDYARLQRIKQTWDPQNLFRVNHNIAHRRSGALAASRRADHSSLGRAHTHWRADTEPWRRTRGRGIHGRAPRLRGRTHADPRRGRWEYVLALHRAPTHSRCRGGGIRSRAPARTARLRPIWHIHGASALLRLPRPTVTEPTTLPRPDRLRAFR